MGKNPIFSPDLTDKGMGIFKVYIALRRFTNMGNDVEGFDVVLFHAIRDRGNVARFIVAENTHAFAFKKSDTKSV
jgi:hypothetical protein